MTCLFCEIASGTLPGHIVLDDDVAFAFLDTHPLFHGHTLVIPKAHVVTIAELPVASVGPYFERVQRIARAMPAALGAQGTFVAMNNIVSQSVAHLHTHVVPRTKGDRLKGFFWPRKKYADDAQMAGIASMLREAVAK